MVNINVPLCKAEGKSIIQNKVMGMWQEQWDSNDTGRHLYRVQRNVGRGRSRDVSRRGEAVMTRLRIGHSGLNRSLFRIRKHQTGVCDYCGQPETAEHVLIGYVHKIATIFRYCQKLAYQFPVYDCLHRHPL